MSSVYCELSTTATLAGRPRVGARVPYLPITERDFYGTVDDPIGAGCESLNLAMYRLGALMLWPHDEERRAEALSVAVAQYGLENAEFTLRNSGVAHTACLDEVIPWARSLADSPRPGDIQDASIKAWRRGIIAGLILNTVIEQAATGDGTVSLDRAKTVVAAKPQSQGGQSRGTYDNQVWGNYRSVAHFWAAYLTRAIVAEEHGSPYHGWQFPCWAMELPDLLSLAETVRKRAETLRPAHASAPVLRPGESWQIQPNVPLPPATLRWLESTS